MKYTKVQRHQRRLARRFGVISAALGLGGALLSPVAAHAGPSDVIISELMYHPTDAVGVEFLELHNTGGTTVDLGNWCVTTAIDVCLPGGTTLGAGGFLLVTDNLAGFAAAYPGAPNPVAEYSGGLSNGGETVVLVNAGGATIDTVSYDDAPPWPTSPDGDGPSLEVINPTANNDDPANWNASVAAAQHTAGAANSQTGASNPNINNVSPSPQRPSANQGVTVSASISEATSATLTYRVNFGAERSLTMTDGPSSPGGANDGVWGATIPGQAAGKLIRYRINASNAGGALSAPSADDSINYYGVVVRSSVRSELPIIEWFMDDAVYDDLLANHRFDDVEGEAVIAYNGLVIDNATMRVRGNSSRAAAKVNWKVELPAGHLLTLPGHLRIPVDEFNLQNDRLPVAETVWITAAKAGAVTPDYFKVRTQRNGEFWSISSISTSYDGRFRDTYGYGDYAVYKAAAGRGRARSSVSALENSGDWEKKERKGEDFTDVWELTQALDAPATAAQKAWMLEHLNIPKMINYAAVVALVRHSDSSWYNYYIARDSEGTGRWEMWMWDVDQSFVTNAEDNDGDFLTPAANGQRFMQALMAHPEFRQMYMRRLKTLTDAHLTGSVMESRYDSISSGYHFEAELDRALWGGYRLSEKRARFITGLTDRRAIFAANQGADGSGLIPPSASGATPIVINELNYDPANGGAFEYIELANTSSSESIDLSGWTITNGVTMTLPAGTVILPNSYALVVSSDADFRSAYGATHFVVGEYDGGLKNSGETITLSTASGATVDSLTWSSTSPWPTGPAGNGPSLSRVSTTAPTNNAGNWAASAATGGTPGAANDGVAPPPPPPNGNAECSIVRDGTTITVTYSNLNWNTFIVTRVANGSGPHWRARIDGRQSGTFTDTDRNATITYALAPRGGEVGTPIDCTEGGGPPPPPPADGASCTITFNAATIRVDYDNVEWSAFVVRRVVNGNGPYWRTRIDGRRKGTFTDTNRTGTITYQIAPAYGLTGEPVDCT